MRRCEVGQLAEAWATLLGAFERSILHAHRSKFTQYLLWFLADKVRTSWQCWGPCMASITPGSFCVLASARPFPRSWGLADACAWLSMQAD